MLAGIGWGAFCFNDTSILSNLCRKTHSYFELKSCFGRIELRFFQRYFHFFDAKYY